MIQESINQLIGTVGIAARLSPSYEKRQEANEAIGKAKIAQAGLEDISENLKKPEKQYTLTELEDIESRVKEHNRNVYTAKTLGESNPYAKKGASQLPRQEVYSPMLKDIESNLEKRKLALQRMSEKGQAAIEQDGEFSRNKDTIFKNRYSSPQEAIGAARLRSEKLDRLRASAIEEGDYRSFNNPSKKALSNMEEQKMTAIEQKQDTQELKDVVDGKVEISKEEKEGEKNMTNKQSPIKKYKDYYKASRDFIKSLSDSELEHLEKKVGDYEFNKVPKKLVKKLDDFFIEHTGKPFKEYVSEYSKNYKGRMSIHDIDRENKKGNYEHLGIPKMPISHIKDAFGELENDLMREIFSEKEE